MEKAIGKVSEQVQFLPAPLTTQLQRKGFHNAKTNKRTVPDSEAG